MGLIRLHEKKSQPLLLEAQFDFRRQDAKDNITQKCYSDLGDALLPLRRMIYTGESSARFKSLRLLNPPTFWENFGYIDPDNRIEEVELINLQWLDIGWNEDASNPVNGDISSYHEHIPKLSCLSVYDSHRIDNLYPRTISTLELFATEDEHFYMRSGAQNTIFSTTNIEAGDDLGISGFELEALEHLEWVFPLKPPRYYTTHLDEIHLPKVKSIVFHRLFANYIPLNIHTSFFKNLPNSFESLTYGLNDVYQAVDRSDDDLMKKLTQIPRSVKHLRFEGTCIGFLNDIFQFKDALNRLSHLTHLEIVASNLGGQICTLPHPHQHHHSFEQRLLVEFVEAQRKVGLNMQFHLGIHGYGADVGLDLWVHRKIVELRREGFSVYFTTT